MIKEYVTDIANQAGMPLSKISVIEGQAIGFLDVHLLHMTTKGHTVSALVYESELNNLYNGLPCERLDIKIRSALSRLKLLLEP
jgi:hypothetical protein